MQSLGMFVAITGLASALLAGPVSNVWYPPRPIPSGCGSLRFEAVLVDVSKSMNRDGWFQQARKNAESFLTNSDPCTLVILGSFGVTADVHEAQFLTTTEARSRLVYALARLRANHTSTNLDEAAKLVELLSYELRDAYGAQANRLTVHVFSDFESSPSIGKSDFSLGEFLARRMDARYMRVYADDNPVERTVNVQAGRAVQGPQTPPPPKQEKAFGVIAFLVSAGLIALGGLVALLWTRSRSRNSAPRGGGLAALLVTESAVPAEGGTPRAVGAERRVEITTGVPAVFSTDANAATYIAALIPGAANGELFRVEPLLDGNVRIQSTHARLTVNEEPLDVDRRVKVDIREPIRVRLGPREFNIVGVFGRPRAIEQTDDVFDAEALQD